MVDHLAQALGDRFQVAPRQAAVGGEPLGEDEQVAALLGEVVVVQRQPAADVGQAVLLGAHRHAVGQRRHLPHDVGDRSLGVAGLALADEPGVLGEAAGVEEQRHLVAIAERPHAAQVLQRHGLTAAGVVGDGHEHRGHVGGPLRQEGVEAIEVHVPLERVHRGRVEPLRDHEVDGLRSCRLDVGPRGVEVGVARDDLVRAADDA